MVGELDVSSIVPSLGSELQRRSSLDWVPLGWFPSFTAPIAGLRLLATPHRARLSLARSFPVYAGGDEISQVPGQPLCTCHGLRPRWADPPRSRAFGPASWRASVAFRVGRRVGLHEISNFGAQPHGLHARCLRFTNTLARAHARLASALVTSTLGRGDSHPGLRSEVSGATSSFLLGQASPGALPTGSN